MSSEGLQVMLGTFLAMNGAGTHICLLLRNMLLEFGDCIKENIMILLLKRYSN